MSISCRNYAYSFLGCFCGYVIAFEDSAILNANADMFLVNRYEASDLLPGQKYTYRVIAHNPLGPSPPSSVVEVRTLSSAPGAPLPPTFSKITPTSVYIKWTSPARDNGKPVTR